MDLSQRALQTNGKFFSIFKLVLELMCYSAMCYISMDSSRHALHTNGKLFFFSNF